MHGNAHNRTAWMLAAIAVAVALPFFSTTLAAESPIKAWDNGQIGEVKLAYGLR